MNDVLAFSLPIPNAWIWPIGWFVVLALIGTLVRNKNQKSEILPQRRIRLWRRNPKQIKSFEIRILNLFRVSSFEFRVSGSSGALIAIILGATSNLIDRTFFGGVTDYLAFTALFPAFNLADLLIIYGLIGWIVVKRIKHNQAPATFEPLK